MHELFRPDIHQFLKLAIEIHGFPRIEMPRPGTPMSRPPKKSFAPRPSGEFPAGVF